MRLAFLEKAIGISTVKVLLALARATRRTKSDLEHATNAIAVEMPRLIRLFRRSREQGLPFKATAIEQGKALLRKRFSVTDATDDVLDDALNLPLQFIMRWVSWDSERDAKLRPILAA